mgnify:CR=1 FL=1
MFLEKLFYRVLRLAAISVVLLPLFFASTLASASESFESGLEAYQRGDYTSAYGHWYRVSQEGHIVAKANLGVLYMEGLGVVQNQKKAFEFLKEAAVTGLPFAQYNLGLMYEEGRGVAQDRIRAHMWFNLAATHGYALAVNGRAKVSRYMTSAAILDAEELASGCLQSAYRDC